MRPFPDVIRIEPAGVCNFGCVHCPIGTEGGHRVILRLDKFKQLFDSLPSVPRVLVLYHGGEPLLNKWLEDMVSYAKQKGVKHVVFNTNASLLTLQRAERLGMAGLDEMRVSFDGDSPDDNNRIRVNSDFDQHAGMVRRMLLSRMIRPQKVVIYNARLGTDEPAPYLKEYFRDCDVEFRGVQMRYWARVDNQPLPSNDVRFCSNLFETFTILSNGDVVMCCEDLQAEDIVGNAYQTSPLELWERMEDRRQNFAHGNYPKLCQSCWVTTGKAYLNAVG